MHHTSNNTYLILQNVIRLVLICTFFEEKYFRHLHTYLLACFYEIHPKFLTSHINFHLDDRELCKQYQSSSQEMMGTDMQFRSS